MMNNILFNLVKPHDPSLFSKKEQFPFGQVDSYSLQNKLIATMIMNGQVSINAGQVGLPYHVFVIKSEPNLVFFNAKIGYLSDVDVTLEEACVNIPGFKTKISRPNEVRLRYQTASGETESKTFKGLTARLIQHNIDYLEGLKFYRTASFYSKNRAEKIIEKSRKEQ